MYNLLVSARYPVWNPTSVDYRCSPKPLRLQQDTFIKSSPVSFKSATSNSAPLKTLRGLIDPYSGITMLAKDELNAAESILSKCYDAKSAVKVLSRYAANNNLLPTEKKMFYIFKNYAKKNPNGTFVDCLNGLRPEARKKLMLEEFDVLDSVDDLSRNMNTDLALAVRHKTTKCRDIILQDNPENPFKRKTLLNSLEEIPHKPSENKLIEDLKQRIEYLPTSGTSVNAFIVKYTNPNDKRKHTEIAKRLLRPSVQSAEHIHPDSLGGANSLGNFILTSAGRNSERGNMSLEEFIKKYPDIPKYTQMHAEQIFDNIHKGKLKGHEDYPYLLKESLYNESKGLININTYSYKYSREKAQKMVDSYNNKNIKTNLSVNKSCQY